MRLVFGSVRASQNVCGLMIAALVAAGLVFAQAAAASPTAAQVSNCVANVVGASQPASVKRAYCSEAIGAVSSIGSRLGLPIIPLISTPGADGFQLEFSATANPSEPTADAATGFNGGSPCYITVYPRLWKSAKTAGRRVHLVLLHEVVHCYQGVVWGSEAILNAAPKFILEGSAEYLAVVAAGYSSAPDEPSWWPDWFDPSGPQPSLLRRSYDAIGWYALLAQVRGSLWHVMPGAWRAYLSGGADAFIDALGGATKAVEEEWGPALLNYPPWGAPWITKGVGIPPDSYAHGVVGASGGSLPAWSGEVDYHAPTSNGLLLVHVTGGYGAVHDHSGHQAIGITDQVFCQDQSKFGCGFKNKTCDNGTNITVDKLYGSYDVAVSSDDGPASFIVRKYTNVNDIPSDISPCDAGVSTATLKYYGEHPCLLLFSTDTNTNMPTSTGETVWNEDDTSPLGGLCSWGTQAADGNIPVDGQIAIQQEPWVQIEAQNMASNAEDVGGLGEQAFCDPGPPYNPGYIPALYIELNSDWYLGVTGSPPGASKGSCNALRGAGHEALSRLDVKH